jgi:hypothetical protein
MQITIELTADEEAALNYVAAKAGTPGTPAVPATETSPAIPEVPEVIVAPEDYLRARVADVLASYGEQMRADDSRLITGALASATEDDRLAVFDALGIDRSLSAAHKVYGNP